MQSGPQEASGFLPSAPDDGQKLYERVAAQIEHLIQSGTLEPGVRVPSLRALSRQMSVSVTTVSEAYRLLEDRGLIEGRPRSGYYVRPATLGASTAVAAPGAAPGAGGVPEPGRTRSTEVAHELRVAEEVLRLHRARELVPPPWAMPCPDYLPVEQLHRFLARAVRHDPQGAAAYPPVQGHERLRVQVARRMLEAGVVTTPADIVITAGAQEAVMLSLRACTRPGDVVAVETPTYYGLLEALEEAGLRAVEVATDPRQGICLDALRSALERERLAACVLIPSFGNPLGHSMPVEARQRLLALLEEFDVPLIEDDTPGELSHSDRRPPAVKAFDQGGCVLYCSSFSKTLAPGYRVGWALPGRLLEDVVRAKFSSSVAVAGPTQMAVAQYLESGAYARHIRKLRGLHRDLVARMIAAVVASFPPGIRITRPQGGFVLWVEMPGPVDSERLRDEAEARGIGLAPGPMFSTVQGYRNCMRLSASVLWNEDVERSLRLLGDLVAKHLGAACPTPG